MCPSPGAPLPSELTLLGKRGQADATGQRGMGPGGQEDGRSTQQDQTGVPLPRASLPSHPPRATERKHRMKEGDATQSKEGW